MAVTTFQEKLASAGARLGSYRGAETAASFGDPAAEFRWLLEASAVYDMGWQAKLVLSGEDRVRWLNGMVTNNIRDLALNHGVYSFVLNPQGRNLGDLVAYNRGDYLLVTTDREQAPKLAELFARYIIMDDVEVGDISERLAAIGVAGPKTPELLRAVGIDISNLQPGEVTDLTWRDIGISVARSPLPQMDGCEIWFASEHADKVWDRWLPREPLRPEARRWNCFVSPAVFRATGSICANAICRRRRASSTPSTSPRGATLARRSSSAFTPAATCIAHSSVSKLTAMCRSPEPRSALPTRRWVR